MNDIKALLDEHYRKMERLLRSHEQRISDMNTEQARRNEASLLRLEMELDALARSEQSAEHG
jgi:hypothetical protein